MQIIKTKTNPIQRVKELDESKWIVHEYGGMIFIILGLIAGVIFCSQKKLVQYDNPPLTNVQLSQAKVRDADNDDDVFDLFTGDGYTLNGVDKNGHKFSINLTDSPVGAPEAASRKDLETAIKNHKTISFWYDASANQSDKSGGQTAYYVSDASKQAAQAKIKAHNQADAHKSFTETQGFGVTLLVLVLLPLLFYLLGGVLLGIFYMLPVSIYSMIIRIKYPRRIYDHPTT